ncbi:DNA-binding response regulator [Candidatus Parcubacteria bacterium]|nr:MAG: DNA-binding response regulator [Candidatus Parcubacteria bacterium]
MKILIVDDDPFVVEMYGLKLKSAGHTVESAEDGQRGMEMIMRGGWDVVLLDIVLPILDGFEVLEALRRRGAAHPPIILLTNVGERADIDRGLLLGAADYLVKTHFTPAEVLAKVEAAANHAAAAPQP